MRRLERCYAYVGIVYYEQGVIQALRAARGEDALKPGSSDAVSSVSQLVILGVLLCLLVARRHAYRPLLRPMLPYATVLLLCVASTLWSDNPVQTVRRSVTLTGCVGFGTYLWRSYGMEGAIAMAGRCAVFLGALSVAVFVAVPSIGRETALGYERAMRGVFSQKNPMAECMLLGITCTCARLLREPRRAASWAALLLLVLCIVLARSATSLAVAALVLTAAAGLGSAGRPRLLLVLGMGLGWAVLAGATVAVLAPGMLFDLLGRDASLTGRGPLWAEVAQLVAQRPWFGHGYAGFWNEDSRDVQYLWLRAGWHAPDAHDGYLNVLLELGVAGLLAYAALWSRICWRTAAAFVRGPAGAVHWVALFMLADAVMNLDEGPLPYANGFTLLMPAALLAVAGTRQRAAARPPVARLGAAAA